MMHRRALLAATAGLGLSGLAGVAVGASEYWPSAASWETIPPEGAALDPVKLSNAFDAAMADRSNALLVLRGGRIVGERYGVGHDLHSSQQIASAAKSMLSILIGIAIDQGKIKGLDQSVSAFIPAWKGTPKSAVTIRHMLSMTSGLDGGKLAVRGISGDQFALNAAAPQRDPPGTRWAYDTAMFHLLYHVVARAVGEPFEAFAARNLTGPLGFQNSSWFTSVGQGASGPVTNYYTAICSARDLGRFGLFALRGGRWDGRRVVSADYLRQATAPSQDLNPSYGFLWWENARPGYDAFGPNGPPALRFPGAPRDTFAALGAGGQVVMVVPSLDLVVIRQGLGSRPETLTNLLASVCGAVRSA